MINRPAPPILQFETLGGLVKSCAEAIRPAENVSVSQAAATYRKINNPGSYVGKWDNDFAPYLIEPMDALRSLDYEATILVGPARCGKTDIFFNWLAHTAICDPADMMIVHMTKGTARDWSIGDLRRSFRHTPRLGEKVTPGRQNMNVHDVGFLAGWRLLVKWPTVTELSGKTIPRVWLTDYDRMPLDIDKEGPAFYLGKKRTTTFGRYAMTAAESSPGHEVSVPNWKASTPHEAPPTPGILSLYNTGDRRLFYWRCAGCGEPFEGDFKHLRYPKSDDIMESAEAARLHCPACDFAHTHAAGSGQPGVKELNRAGRWIKEGEIWLPNGKVVGKARRSATASFWLKGTAAAFTNWTNLVHKYLSAKQEYETTRDTGPLKTTVNVDQGHPFTPPDFETDRTPEAYQKRAQPLGYRVVPEGVLFLVATVDVQKRSFEVLVEGIGPGGDVWVIDRFSIKTSNRDLEDVPGQKEWLDPATYPEDWDLITSKVLTKTYPLSDDSGRHMSIKAAACDSGGRAGVTAMAYAYYRRLRDDEETKYLLSRFILIKGTGKEGAPRVSTTYPDSERKDRKAGARGEIPVLLINTNLMKDSVSSMLGRTDVMGGRVSFPDWLKQEFYAELTAEVRTDKGWENPKRSRNESFDLMVYGHALCVSPRFIALENMDWGRPPDWAQSWDKNSLVFNPNDTQERPSKKKVDLTALASELA